MNSEKNATLQTLFSYLKIVIFSRIAPMKKCSSFEYLHQKSVLAVSSDSVAQWLDYATSTTMTAGSIPASANIPKS